MAVAFAEDLDGVSHVGKACLAGDAPGPDFDLWPIYFHRVAAEPADEMMMMARRRIGGCRAAETVRGFPI
jgi:hypothetical protein